MCVYGYIRAAPKNIKLLYLNGICFVEAIHIQTCEQLKTRINRELKTPSVMMECACGISGSLNQECRKRLIRQMFRVRPKRDCIFAALSASSHLHLSFKDTVETEGYVTP